MPRTAAQQKSRKKYRRKAATLTKEQAYTRAYYQRNRALILLRVKLRKYGLTPPEYNALIARADGRCETCGVLFDDAVKALKPHIDHCHATEKVRGLLCASCNWAIGNVRDSTETLRALIDYLEAHRADR